MKQSILLPLLLVFVTIFISNCNNEIEICAISGKITGRSSDTLILMNALEDPRFATIKIPITDSTFSYNIEANPVQAYWLVFQDEIETGGFKPITIFPDEHQINLTLYPAEQFENNKIDGGKTNTQFGELNKLLKNIFKDRYKPINDSISILFKQNTYHSDSMQVLYDKLRESTSQDTNIVIYNEMSGIRERGNDLTGIAKEQDKKLKAISREQYQWMLNYFENHPSISSYYNFIRRCLMYQDENTDLQRFMKLQEILSGKFNDHPYKVIADDLIGSFNYIKIGGKFIDFTIPDMNGNQFTLSELIEGEIALIDLWATWCGPCIATARSMIPVYEEYKDKGFTIVGVAAEIENIDRLKIALEREKFPWLNLVELGHQNNIWHKYGISNSGGKTFLVDRNGEIIAISPTSEDVRRILEEML